MLKIMCRRSLYGLNVTLRKLKAKSSGDQSRIPFSKRNAKFSTRFLPVSVPFHSEYLAAVPDKVMRDLHKRGLVFTADQLLMPVFATDDGRDLAEERAGGSESLTESVVRLVCCKHVDWPKGMRLRSLACCLRGGLFAQPRRAKQRT